MEIINYRKMKKYITILLSLIVVFSVSCSEVKPKLMWLDCSANWERFSNVDSIKYYVEKCKDVGMTALVLDVKGTASALVYKSDFAPELKEWKGVVRPDFDFVKTFVDEAHANGLEIYASFNVFAEGSGVFKKGILYDTHSHWQATNYVPGKGLQKQVDIDGKLVMFTNPAQPEVQDYQINIFKESVRRFDFDGIILDRARYDNIQSDFSDFSRGKFEEYIGRKVVNFPEDIYEWIEVDGKYKRENGTLFNEWIEWRASVIYNFFKRAKQAVKAINPDIKFAAYTGAWYPSYYEVGVNWASNSYDPSTEYSWATPRYKEYAYGDMLDFFTNGNYYYNVTIDEYRTSNGLHMNETDSEFSKGDHLCVEGGCIYSRKLLGENPFYGGMYVEDYKKDKTQFKRAVEMNLKMSDGLMVFDIVHIINRNWWDELESAIDNSAE